MDNKKRLLKLAYSTNDHTIPNNICINEINNTEKSNRLLNSLSNVTDSGNTTQNIKQFNFDLYKRNNTK